ncbi:circadian locomoter output cycles protein kaput-like isoform X2 [Artemia franciscana]
MDEKGVVKRKSRNLSEKKRRDQFNILIGELCTMVCSGKRKMDKSTVLKTAIAFIRNHNQISAQLQGQEIPEDWKPSFLSNEEFTHLILEALDGFILVFGTDGKILYASENITSLLGHLPNDLLSRSIYDFILADDKKHIIDIVQNPDNGASASSPDADNPVTFSCHFKRGTKSFVYEVVHFTGYFRSNSGTRPCSPSSSISSRMDDSSISYNDSGGSSSVVFVASGRLLSPQLLTEKSLIDTKSEFASRHSLEWKFLFLDHRAPPIIGYLPFEVLGTSGYDYYHVEDLEKVAAAHEILMQKGEGMSCYYRFLTKGQQWIWIQTKYYISYHQWNSKPEFIVCTHRVVSYNEVIGRPVVKNESPASCLSTGGRPRNSDSRSSSRADKEECRAQLRSITKRSDASRARGPGRPSSQGDSRRPRSRASLPEQQTYNPPPAEVRHHAGNYPDSSATHPPISFSENLDEIQRVEENHHSSSYEFQQPVVPVVAFKSEPPLDVPPFAGHHFKSSQSYRSSDRIGSSESDASHPAHRPSHHATRHQDKHFYIHQSDQMSTGSNESRRSDQRSSHQGHQSRIQPPPTDAMSVGSSDSHHSVHSEPVPIRSSLTRGSRENSPPLLERQARSVESVPQSPVVLPSRSGFVTGYTVSSPQFLQLRQGSNLVTVGMPTGSVISRNISAPHRYHERAELLEEQSTFTSDRRPSTMPLNSHHGFRPSVPMVVDASGNSIPIMPIVQGEGQRVQIIDGVPMMTLPMQPLVMTAAQKQLHEQLQQKHAQLQRQLLQQQEELRKISEQLLFSQFGSWGSPVIKMTVPYDEGELPNNAQSLRSGTNERIENESREIQNMFNLREDPDTDNLQYSQRDVHMVARDFSNESSSQR